MDAIDRDLYQLMKCLRAAKLTDMYKYSETFERLISDLSVGAEKTACLIRHIIYNNTSIKKSELMARVAEAQGIKICHDDRWITITLPILIEKKKHKTGEFITYPLFCALSEYTLVNELTPLSHAVIRFKHIYDRTLPDRRVRDYDNLEENKFWTLSHCLPWSMIRVFCAML